MRRGIRMGLCGYICDVYGFVDRPSLSARNCIFRAVFSLPVSARVNTRMNAKQRAFFHIFRLIFADADPS